MPTALFSVSDKTGLIEFASGLHSLGWRFLASGGTAKALREAGIPVTDIAEYTGSPEILQGRVKTLHPAVHGGILARNTSDDAADLARIHAEAIDLVVVNLYPFKSVIAQGGVSILQAIENIDIGGVALLRAAAKNFARVAVVSDSGDYAGVLKEIQEKNTISVQTRHALAIKAFAHTADYDAAIATYLSGGGKAQPDEPARKTASTGAETALDTTTGDSAAGSPLQLTLYPIQTLRYGENPHQSATLYGYRRDGGPLGGQLLHGKPLSYNNLLDLDAAWRAALSYDRDTVVIVKHLSPCGIASAQTLEDAFQMALASDPISAFGGVIAVNRPFDRSTAKALGKLFVECIIAPGFTPKALEMLQEKKNLRLVSMADTQASLEPLVEMRSVNQGILVQDLDLGDPQTGGQGEAAAWKTVSQRAPDEKEWRALKFAWKAVQYAKSNAIVFAQAYDNGEATVGIGSGQPNRVDCVRIAVNRAGEKSRRAVMASDAFFPFPDSVEEAARAGITAVVHPGGSVRDQEAIDAANAAGMAMVTSGVRHFRH